MVKNKRVLQEIAKRFAKAILKDAAQEAFADTLLTHDEEVYIGNY